MVGRALAALVVVLVAGACAPAPAPVAVDKVTLRFHYSRFEPASVTVPPGQPVTFTLRNDDPIEHEWIVGLPAVHAQHRVGNEPWHAERPTEVSVPPLATRTTEVTFDQPGDYEFICHLPGHEAYGMRGILHVTQP